jgi:proteasome accessory factor C
MPEGAMATGAMPGWAVPGRRTAADQLRLVLHLLPAASREGGIGLDELAESLDMSREDVLRCVQEVSARSYYHPAGAADDIQIFLEEDRIEVWTTGAFQRPVRLTPREALCLALALRCQGAAAAVRDAQAREHLLERIESHLATSVTGSGDDLAAFAHADDLDPDEDGIRETLLRAAREGEGCTIGYLKEGAECPEVRRVRPYTVVLAEGKWYVVAYCEERAAERTFRLDRVLGARSNGVRFEVPGKFDPREYFDGGRVYRAESDATVTVRYAPEVARWIVEQVPEAELKGDGSVVLEHRVGDPRWLVRHVLGFGEGAEVVGPGEMRGVVRGAVAKWAEGSNASQTGQLFAGHRMELS